MNNRQSAGKQPEFRPMPLDLNGFESNYEVTSDGRVYSHYMKTFLKPFASTGGYLRVKLNYGSQNKKVMAHRLVAMAFIPNPENKPVVNHKNCIRTDNRVENLEWVTCTENMRYAASLGRKDVYKYTLTNTSTGETVMGSSSADLSKKLKRNVYGALSHLPPDIKYTFSQGLLKGWEAIKERLDPQRLSQSASTSKWMEKESPSREGEDIVSTSAEMQSGTISKKQYDWLKSRLHQLEERIGRLESNEL